MNTIATALRVAHPKALSTLVRILGSLDFAEDVLQEASARALDHWAQDGVPDEPAAWLVRTARNFAIDGYRRSGLARRHAVSAAHDLLASTRDPAPHEVGLRDDMLRLVVTCCHPALPLEAQVALTLKAVAGLSEREIGRAFLVAPRTIEQRITRAKRRIREEAIPYEVPGPAELPERLAGVMAVIYLIFSEGHSSSVDAPLIRHALCRLAIDQARGLCRLVPGVAEAEGLLSLMLLTHARSPARVRGDGVPIPLDRQDRTCWSSEFIREGLALLHTALSRGQPGRYQVEAAISAVHSRAAHWDDTDWLEIVQLYDALLDIAPSPAVRLNRSVAVSRVLGAVAGLALVDALQDEKGMRDRLEVHAVRAGLLVELEDWQEARCAAISARSTTQNSYEQKYFDELLETIERKIDENSDSRDTDVGKAAGTSS